MKAPLPPDEVERLISLRRYEILDTDPEQEFDDITLLASHICGTPIALISLVDENRQWFKSKVGLTESETSRDIAFCAHGILQRGVFEVNDAQADERFAANPMVTGSPRIRFYAGAPLITSDGHALGMLCVTDQTPRKLSTEQRTALQALSRQVVTQLELRLSLTELRETVIQLKRTAEALRDSEEKFRQLAQNISDVFWMTSPDLQQVHYVSPAYEQMWGRSAASLYEHPQQWAEAIVAEDRERVFATFNRMMADELSVSVEFRIVRPDGQVRVIHSRGFQVRDVAGKLIRLTGIATDITERKRFEAQLIQSQNMETVGKLAGGIAHEFNSILTVIIGRSELLLRDLPGGSPLTGNAAEISTAATRAATLTRQLLAYSRKQFLQPEALDLNQLLVNLARMVQFVMGGDVDVQIVPAPGLHAVKADAGQIKQVIMNIAMNAAEAMPNGGKLTLETTNVTVAEEYVGHFPGMKAGEYVMLAFTDTGTGMSEEIRGRVFEPFFTTKEVGQGTGLGLSTCYGILKQSGGHISVESELTRGATFKIYLPRDDGQGEPGIRDIDSPELPCGTETIMLVEDDSAFRQLAATLLRRLGYTVVATNGIDALSLKHRRDITHVDLLFADVVAPNMSDKVWSERALELYPNTKMLFTSVHGENHVIPPGVPNKRAAVLQKPFTPSALAHKLREVLDQPV
jgi:two-component system, cell cycle sensor histidine kinase and response regulator CckA